MEPYPDSIEVSKKARQAASNCYKDLACLTDGEAQVCKVKACLGSGVLFVHRRPAVDCPFKVTFGSGQLCECPVRKEIFERYKM